MKEDILKNIMLNLQEKPIDQHSKHLFINRADILTEIGNYLSISPGIYGICGNRGIGKTSLLKMISFQHHGFFIYIRERRSKHKILLDMLYQISSYGLKMYPDNKTFKECNTYSKYQIIETTSLSGGVDFAIQAHASTDKSKTIKETVYTVYECLEQAVDELIKTQGSLTLFIDELDKEKKDEVEEILSSIKYILKKPNMFSIISLPMHMYVEYVRDKLSYTPFNLDNIIDDMFVLKPLSDSEIKEMITTRLSPYTDIIDDDILNYITIYSEGNPREAIYITKKILIGNKDKEHITSADALSVIKKLVSSYEEYIDISPREKDILSVIIKHPERSEAIKHITQTLPMQKNTASTYISRLKKKGYLSETNGLLRVSGKIYFLVADM